MAQSTGEKPGEESSTSRNLQVFGSIVGLVAFFLGVQNIGELKQKLFPSPAVASATPSPTWQPASRSGHDREAVKWRYNLDLATFSHAHDSFINGANRFGFRGCNYTFPTTSPWN